MEEKVLIKKGTVFVVGFLSFLFALFIGVGLCYYFIGYEHSEFETQKEENIEVVDINVADIENLIYSYEFIAGIESYTSIIYEHTTIDEKLINSTVVSELGVIDEILLNDYISVIEKFFGEDVASDFIPVDFTVDSFKYVYDEVEEKFTYVMEGGYGGYAPWQIRKLYSISLEGDTLKARVAVGMCEDNYDDYRQYTCENLDSSYEVEDAASNFDINNDYMNLTKFEYTFKYSDKNESYYIVDIIELD